MLLNGCSTEAKTLKATHTLMDVRTSLISREPDPRLMRDLL